MKIHLNPLSSPHLTCLLSPCSRSLTGVISTACLATVVLSITHSCESRLSLGLLRTCDACSRPPGGSAVTNRRRDGRGQRGTAAAMPARIPQSSLKRSVGRSARRSNGTLTLRSALTSTSPLSLARPQNQTVKQKAKRWAADSYARVRTVTRTALRPSQRIAMTTSRSAVRLPADSFLLQSTQTHFP